MRLTPGEVVSKALEKKQDEHRGGDSASVPEERRCTHVYGDGRRCKQRRWREKELCFHHDPEAAELRKPKGVPVSELRMISATEVHALLTKALEDLQAKRINPGEAYAIGYLAQLVLTNLKAMGEEYDEAKTQWDRYQEIRWRVLALDEGTYEEKVLGETEEPFVPPGEAQDKEAEPFVPQGGTRNEEAEE